jgi:hypothetical protein
MSGPKRNPDRLNTIGVVVVGICGAVLVYVTIVALEAFYVNDTSEIQVMADYGGQDTGAKSLRTEQVNRIGEYGTNPRPAAAKANEAQRPQTYRVPIDVAMKRVVAEARTDPAALVPSLGRSEKATVLPIFGRPRLIPAAPAAGAGSGSAAPAAGAGSGSAAPAAPAAGAGAGSAAPAAGAGSAAPAATAPPAAPLVPTGAGTGPAPVSGAGPLTGAPPPATPAAPPSNKQPAPAAPAAAPSNKQPVPAAPAAAPSNKPAAPAAAPKGNGQ